MSTVMKILNVPYFFLEIQLFSSNFQDEGIILRLNELTITQEVQGKGRLLLQMEDEAILQDNWI